ncbi:MAG: orotate phosphoribosyltransferase [Pseudomonadota bacterium]
MSGHDEATMEDLRAQAFEIIRTRSFMRGEVRLASGRMSDHYFDMKPSMLDPVGAGVLARMLFARIAPAQVDHVGGLEMGAVPLLGPLAMVSAQANQPLPAFFVRKTVKAHGTQRLIEGVRDLAGKRVAIVEDVTTTGGSAMASIKAVQAEGAEVALVISLLDREQGAAALYREAGLAFDWLFQASAFLNT